MTIQMGILTNYPTLKQTHYGSEQQALYPLMTHYQQTLTTDTIIHYFTKHQNFTKRQIQQPLPDLIQMNSHF